MLRGGVRDSEEPRARVSVRSQNSRGQGQVVQNSNLGAGVAYIVTINGAHPPGAPRAPVPASHGGATARRRRRRGPSPDARPTWRPPSVRDPTQATNGPSGPARFFTRTTRVIPALAPLPVPPPASGPLGSDSPDPRARPDRLSASYRITDRIVARVLVFGRRPA